MRSGWCRFVLPSFSRLCFLSLARRISQNIKGAAPLDRQSILTSLRLTEAACHEASSGPQTMSAYMARLTAHLFKKAEATVAVSGPAEEEMKPRPSVQRQEEMSWSGGGAGGGAGEPPVTPGGSLTPAGVAGAAGGGFVEGWGTSTGQMNGGGVPALGGVGASAMMSNQLVSLSLPLA